MLEHGANPGLISHFTKQGLLDIGARLLADKKVDGRRRPRRSPQLMADRTFNHLAMKLGVKVIHCSERDTQITDQPKQVDEFVNTWSVEGFREEGTTTAEMGWGTHEKELPPLAYEHAEGPRNQICLARMGINTWVRSWVPHYCDPRHGRPPRRGLHHLRPADGLGGRPSRSTARRSTTPTARATRPSPRSTSCAATTTQLQPQLRIMTDEITSGSDILGALLMGHAYQLLVDRQRPEHRGVAPPGAAPERHDHAGGDLGGGRRDVDDREPGGASACPTTCRTTTSWGSPSRTWASSSRRRPTGRR